MKKSEILEATTQYLIVKLMYFNKARPEAVFQIVNELIKRKVIENDMEFISRLRGYLRCDCIPEKYKSLLN